KQFYKGAIDDLRIYSRALSAGEVASDMNTPVPDLQPPTAPAGLTAVPLNSNQVDLSWTASTDSVGGSNYLIESCQGAGCTTFTQIGTTTTTGYSSTGLSGGTPYSYRVRATDAAGNLSPYSNVVSVTTPASDTVPPTTPTNLTATAVSSTQINLSWTGS